MIHINIGSNLDSKFGTKFKNISIAINLLIESKLRIKKISSFYSTPSFPNKDLPKFLNIGATIETKTSPNILLKKFKLIENRIGRKKTKKNDPRVCDIDIIDFGGIIKRNKLLELPHPRCHLRNFVLYPIREIDPQWKHPILKKNIDFLINDLSQKSRIEITRLKKSVII
jgi:2-amino-4-hydroxy-6-hydroxymethyldihydropteridine diphosphokinase|tara:strand:- start:373 stop:882 length:510 start_codon:yes stop_codon:yes gene_type:complete